MANLRSKHAERLLADNHASKKRYLRQQIVELDPAFADLEEVLHNVMLQCASTLRRGESPAACVVELHAYLSKFVMQSSMVDSTGTQLIEATKTFQQLWDKVAEA